MSSSNSAYTVSFYGASRPAVRLHSGAILSEHLTVENSPVLFGCRTGICGTCLIEVESQENGQLPDPLPDEQELLDIIAPDLPNARLACQIALCADIKIRYIGK
ncbi:MAG TPA: 2Fe-2S iron-sulfur cluster-binding protein [Blastocatellia bacterium]|nr:2Fe-2S iron-sulfur cluster-binding protein [Blastocatellia bacterium]